MIRAAGADFLRVFVWSPRFFVIYRRGGGVSPQPFPARRLDPRWGHEERPCTQPWPLQLSLAAVIVPSSWGTVFLAQPAWKFRGFELYLTQLLRPWLNLEFLARCPFPLTHIFLFSDQKQPPPRGRMPEHKFDPTRTTGLTGQALGLGLGLGLG